MNHKQALEAVIAAWDAPHYGDTDTRLDNVFDAVEAARKVVAEPLTEWHAKPSARGFCHIFGDRGRLLARNVPERAAATLIAEHNSAIR